MAQVEVHQNVLEESLEADGGAQGQGGETALVAAQVASRHQHHQRHQESEAGQGPAVGLREAGQGLDDHSHSDQGLAPGAHPAGQLQVASPWRWGETETTDESSGREGRCVCVCVCVCVCCVVCVCVCV